MGLKFQQSTCVFDPLFSLFGALLIYIIPVEPHEAVAEVSRIGNV